jgi:hypothetical protein
MPGIIRFFLLILLLTVTFVTTATVTAAHLLRRSGSASLRVIDHSTGSNLRMTFPAGLIDLAATIPGKMHTDHETRDLLLQLAADLESMSDSPLLQIEGSRGETVLIQKEADRYRISIDSSDASIRITLPPQTFEKLLRKLARSNRHRLTIVASDF